MAHPFIEELSEYVKFLQSVWGILAGITAIFPLSNQLFSTIPLPEEFLAGSFTLLATLGSIFVVFLIFGHRDAIEGSNRTRVLSAAIGLFICGFISSTMYFSSYLRVFSEFIFLPYELNIILALVFYTAFFTLTTASFTLLGTLEFVKTDEQTSET